MIANLSVNVILHNPSPLSSFETRWMKHAASIARPRRARYRLIMKFDAERFWKMVNTHGHNAMLGISYQDSGEDWVELSLPYDARLAGDPETGILASGPIVTLMDMATSISIWVKSGAFVPQATLDLRVDYLRPATPGKTVIGRGQCYRITRSIAFIRGQAHDGDANDPIAHVAGTYMFTGPLA